MSLDKLGINLNSNISGSDIDKAMNTYMDIIINKKYEPFLKTSFLSQQCSILEKTIKELIVKKDYYLNLNYNDFMEFTSYFYNDYEDSKSYLLFNDINKYINLKSIDNSEFRLFLYCVFFFNRYHVNCSLFKSNSLSKRNIELLNSIGLKNTITSNTYDTSKITDNYFIDAENEFFASLYKFKRLYASYYYMMSMLASYLKINNKLNLLSSVHIDIINKAKEKNDLILDFASNSYFLNHINFYDLTYVIDFIKESKIVKEIVLANFNTVGFVKKNKFLFFKNKFKIKELFNANDNYTT